MPGPLAKWLSRHQDPTNFWLHMIGIPGSFVAPPILMIRGQWLMAAGMFVAGYATQFIGHLVEGNRSGEEELVRRLIAGRRPSE